MMGDVRSVKLTTLVDNHAKSPSLLPSQGGTGALLAEHGLSFMVEVEAEDGAKHCFMLDAGSTSTSLLYNMDRLKLDPRKVEFLVISHGHWDHVGSVVPLIQRIKKELPVIAHPEVFRERWKVFTDGRKEGPRQVDRRQWEEAGARLVIDRDSREFLPGCFTTGEVPRKNDYEKTPESARFSEGGKLVADNIPDDQSVAVRLKDRGLVILAGCAHSGIINTIHQARAVSGVDKIWAVIGGFHLYEVSEERLAWTIEQMQAADPHYVVPTHCTGFHAQAAFAQSMPEAFTFNTVGATHYFS